MNYNHTVRVPHKKNTVCTAPIFTELAKSERHYVPSHTPNFTQNGQQKWRVWTESDVRF